MCQHGCTRQDGAQAQAVTIGDINQDLKELIDQWAKQPPGVDDIPTIADAIRRGTMTAFILEPGTHCPMCKQGVGDYAASYGLPGTTGETARAIAENWWDANCQCKPPPEPPPGCEPPFEGGQCEGVLYLVGTRVSNRNPPTVWSPAVRVRGPILSASLSRDEIPPFGNPQVQLIVETRAGVFGRSGFPKNTGTPTPAYLSVHVQRVDGLPDDCGNPPLPPHCYPPPEEPPPPSNPTVPPRTQPDMIIVVSGPEGPQGPEGPCPTLDFEVIVTADETPSAEVLSSDCDYLIRLYLPEEDMVLISGAISIDDCEGGTRTYNYNGQNFDGVQSLGTALSSALTQLSRNACPNLEGEYDVICSQDEAEANAYIEAVVSIVSTLIVDGLVSVLGKTKTLQGIAASIILQIVSGVLSDALTNFFLQFIPTQATETVTYQGRGFRGLSSQLDALNRQVEKLGDAVCQNTDVEEISEEGDGGKPAVVLLPAEPYDELQVPTQLVVKFGENYPHTVGSRWHVHIPYPIDNLNWCDHFEDFSRTVVDANAAVRWCARLYWENTKTWSGGYFGSEGEADTFLDRLIGLSKSTPTKRTVTKRTKIGGLAAGLAIRNVRAVRAIVGTIDSTSGRNEVVGVRCYAPPKEGCG